MSMEESIMECGRMISAMDKELKVNLIELLETIHTKADM